MFSGAAGSFFHLRFRGQQTDTENQLVDISLFSEFRLFFSQESVETKAKFEGGENEQLKVRTKK